MDTPTPIKLTDHLYQLGTPRFPVYLSMGAKGMLIEGGTGGTADLIVDQVAGLGIEPERIAYLALTHTHADHIGALPRLRRSWPHLAVLASRPAAEALAATDFTGRFIPLDGMVSHVLVEMGVIPAPPPQLDRYDFSVDVVLEEGAFIELGRGVQWHVLRTPGHSDCHTSYFETRENILALGDMTGYFDPDRDIIWPNYFSSLQDYCLSIQKVALLPAWLGLLSHNGVVDLSRRPFLEQALRGALDYHAGLLARMAGGEDRKSICREQAAWVYSYAPIASVKAIEYLVGQLCANSRLMSDLDLCAPLGWSLTPRAAGPDLRTGL